MCTYILYGSHTHFSTFFDRLQIRQSGHKRHLFGLLDDSPRGPTSAVAGLLPRHVAEAANRSLQTYEEPPRAQVGRDAAATLGVRVKEEGLRGRVDGGPAWAAGKDRLRVYTLARMV